MKQISLIVFLAFAIFNPLSLYAQGSLMPSGPPGPTMLTLKQVEPRRPISIVTNLTEPGSYYLTANLNVSTGTAITISTNGVTLDLNGFTIYSSDPANSGTGILLAGGTSGNSDIAIYNGHIRGSVTNNSSGVFSGNGFYNGIEYSGAAPVNVRVANVTVSGCLGDGIFLSLGNPTIVDSCLVQTVGGNGIYAGTVLHSEAYGTGNSGIFGTDVSDSTGESVNAQSGVYAYDTAANCNGQASGLGYGVSGTVVINCVGESTGNGVGVAGLQINNSYGVSLSNGDGIQCEVASGCYGYSFGSGSGINTVNFGDGVVMGSYGYSASGIGLYTYVASFSDGEISSGTGIDAFIANGCYSAGSDSLITHKYNMP